ncbi:MAG: phenylacetate--CoA ligase [Candidatus Methanofastidiosa archaeon]|nr:phenylacetate--CoA ligase [Candidatus Methanofastidiosa archaeon]
MDREKLEKFQLKYLKNTIKHAYYNSLFYRDSFSEAGVSPEDINSLKDLQKLPFIAKDNIRKDQEAFPPLGQMTSVPEKEVVYISVSSGSTGMPTASPFTAQDFEEWIDYEARQFYSSGMRSTDKYCHALNMSLFVGGPCVLGAQKIGALSIHTGTIPSERLLRIITQFKPTIIWTTPSYAWYLGETAKKQGIDVAHDTSIKKIFVAGEPGGSIKETRNVIEKLWGADVYDYYGISDIFGSCAGECEEKTGLHFAEDHMIVEVLDLKTGEPVGEGEKGEMVLTTIRKIARPLIRFRTGDIVSYELDKCPCGRTHLRLKGVSGRTDDMLIIKGVNVLPSSIEAIVRSNTKLSGEYRLVVERIERLDALTVEVERTDNYKGDIKILEGEVQRDIKAVLGITPKVKVYDDGTLPRETHKAKRIVDKRKNVWK